MKTLLNALNYWFIEGKDCHGDAIAAWWALTSIILALIIGFCFLTWFFPKIAGIVFIVLLLPGFMQLYVRFSDKKLDARIEELKRLMKQEEESRRGYNRW